MFRLSDHLFPLVLFQSIGDCGPQDIDAAEKSYRKLFERRQPFLSISDARRAANHASQRQLWADLTARLSDESAKWTVASVVILDSAPLRAALTAVNWITRPSIPQYVAGSTVEAGTMIGKLAVECGLTLPADFESQFEAWLKQGVEASLRQAR